MFTGLVETTGEVARSEPDGSGGRRIALAAPFANDLVLGESVAINGACLTVVAFDAKTFSVAAGPETLRRTNLGGLSRGARVNLERALEFGDRLGGHLVQGHVDGVGTLTERLTHGDWQTLWFALPPALATQMVSKGSVSVDGVSLTLVDVLPDRFSVAVIPHTLTATTLGQLPVGAGVNIETDLIGKYVAKWMENGRP